MMLKTKFSPNVDSSGLERNSSIVFLKFCYSQNDLITKEWVFPTFDMIIIVKGDFYHMPEDTTVLPRVAETNAYLF